MNRRAILRTFGVGIVSLGGCARLRSIRSADRTRISTSGNTLRRLTVQTIRPGELPQLDVEPSVEVLEPTVTDAHTGKIELSLTNESDRRRTLTYESRPPADEHTASRSDGEKSLVLLRSDEQDFTPASERCWRLSEMDFFVGEPCGPDELVVNAGETLLRTYELWDYPQNERCMPPGEYRFGEVYRIDGQEYEWEFVARVTEP